MSAAHTDALPQVLAFARRFGEQHAALAMHAAVPLGLTPELVHLLRVNFVRAAEWIAEADLLLSPLCHEAGAELYEMDPAVRQLLLDELQQDADFGRSRRREVVAFLEVYARQAQPGASREMRDFLQALLWGARSEIDPASTARELLEALAGAGADDPAEMVRIAEVADALSTPLLEERGLLLYTAELRRRASDFAPAFDSTGEATIVQGVALPALVAASTFQGEPAASEEPILERAFADSLTIEELTERVNAIERDESLRLIALRASETDGQRLTIAKFEPHRGAPVSAVSISELSDDWQERDTYLDWLRSKDGALVDTAEAWVSGRRRSVALHSWILETPPPDPFPSGTGPGRWVLVAGLASEQLPREVAETAKALGRALADAGYGLITGGSSGVDDAAAREYCARLTAHRRRAEEWLLQVLSPLRSTPKLNLGKLIHAPEDGWQTSIERADAMVTLSGGTGTKYGADLARASGKPVLPIPATGLFSAELHETMVSEWSMAPLRGVSVEEFKRLSAKEPETQMVAVFALLKTLFTMDEAPVIPGAVYLSYAREDHEAALRVRDQLQAARITVWMDETILQPGDLWQAKLDSVLQECSLFVPLLSQHTARRPDGLFRREWSLALERRSRLSRERPFILPIVVSEKVDMISHDLPKELAEINWVRAPHGHLPPNLPEEIRDWLRKALSEAAETPRDEPAHWILIVGLASDHLPPHLAEITEALGKALARAGYGLIGGGWPGVDHVAARAFGSEVRAMGRAEDRWLRQFVLLNQKADYPGGRIEHVEDDWGALVEHADAVILLSGSGGTRRLGEMGHAGGKLVLPLAVTGGDAADLWKKIADEWETNPVRGLTMNDFARIGVSNPAPLEAVISLLAKVLTNEENGGLEAS